MPYLDEDRGRPIEPLHVGKPKRRLPWAWLIVHGIALAVLLWWIVEHCIN